jgi:hypothetical protein
MSENQVKAQINPIHWFLNDREDVRSSFFLEDVATEFHIQGYVCRKAIRMIRPGCRSIMMGCMDI